MFDSFDARERKIFRHLDSPAKIQKFLDDEIGYNLEPGGDTCYSPRRVLRESVAHCMEGALLGALALRRLGYPPLLVDLEAVRDTDDVLAVYRVDGRWGAVAKSDYSGLRSREPVYSTIRELAMSYFEHFFNPAGEKTLRAYSRPVSLARFDREQTDGLDVAVDLDLKIFFLQVGDRLSLLVMHHHADLNQPCRGLEHELWRILRGRLLRHKRTCNGRDQNFAHLSPYLR